MQTTVANVHYQFIPSKVLNFAEIGRSTLILQNDIYEKYAASAEISGELIVCRDKTKMANRAKKLERETYSEYMQTIERRDPTKDAWIYNIIDGLAEQDAILHRDALCVVIINYTWDATNADELHFLCLPTDKSLRSMRSLTAEHIPLLEHMKRETIRVIRDTYQIDEQHLKMFFHYDPSTYHLHIHFVNIVNSQTRSSVEYSHELHNVMFNLSICSDYYKRAVLNIRQ
jgi:m7GpppX diphosphatase